MQESTQTPLLQPLKQPSAFALSHALYNHQVKIINQKLTSPLAQQSASTLLSLLEGELFSLTKRYEYLQKQNKLPEIADHLNQNQQILATLTQQIHQQLLQKCQSHGLDDDSRLIIYDILHAAGYDKEQLYRRIIQSIPKRTYQKLCDAKVVKKSLSDVYSFTQQVSKALAILPTKPNHWQSAITEFKKQFSSISPFWRLRYLFYFMLSLGAYYLLMQAVTMLGIFLLSEKLLAFISSTLFYGVGLLPLWWFCGQFVFSQWNHFIERWRVPKQSQIVEALYVLEHTQQWIGYRLSQVIVDIVRTDIDSLKSSLNQRQEVIQGLITQLNTFTISEKMLAGSALKCQAQRVSNRLYEQQVELEMTLQRLVDHLTSRVKEEIQLLGKPQGKSLSVPLLSIKKYLQIKKFIGELGTKGQQKNFEEQTNMATLWQKQLPQFTLLDKTKQPNQQQPWGTHVLRQDSLQGWQTLLSQWQESGISVKSARVLNELLRNKRKLTMAAFLKVIERMVNPKERSTLISTIQSILFNTLSIRDPSAASLLGKIHKNQIRIWYQDHKTSISTAKQVMEALLEDKTNKTFASYPDTQLAECYELLEGADIYHYSQNDISKQMARNNKIKQFLTEYEGQTSRAFLFLRFIPKHLTLSLHVQIAQKRLQWLLSHLGSGVNAVNPFDEHDLELFLAHALSKQHQAFNFANIVRSHPQFTKPSKMMSQFLKACREFGLDDGQLFEAYQAKSASADSLQQFKQYKTPLVKPSKERAEDHVGRKKVVR